MVEAELSRKYINGNVNRIRRAFKWAVSEELLPVPDVAADIPYINGIRHDLTKKQGPQTTVAA